MTQGPEQNEGEEQIDPEMREDIKKAIKREKLKIAMQDAYNKLFQEIARREKPDRDN